MTAGGRVPSPQQLGYAGMVLERLAEHARTVLGFDQAWILVSAPRRSAPLVAVAGAGTDPDLIGRSIGVAAAWLRPAWPPRRSAADPR